MKIIPLKIDNIDKLIPLWLGMVSELEPESTPNEDWFKDQVVSLYNNGSYQCFIAVMDGDYIGFCDGLVSKDPVLGKIVGTGCHIYIKPEFRLSGLVDRLYKACVEEQEDRGAELFETQCYPGRVRFWEKLNFKPIRTVMRRI